MTNLKTIDIPETFQPLTLELLRGKVIDSVVKVITLSGIEYHVKAKGEDNVVIVPEPLYTESNGFRGTRLKDGSIYREQLTHGNILALVGEEIVDVVNQSTTHEYEDKIVKYLESYIVTARGKYCLFRVTLLGLWVKME